MSDAVLRGASNRKEKGKRQRAVKTQKLHSQFDSLHCCILGWYLFFFLFNFGVQLGGKCSVLAVFFISIAACVGALPTKQTAPNTNTTRMRSIGGFLEMCVCHV